MDTQRNCKLCKGSKITKGWTSENTGTVFPDRPCYACKGVGTFDVPDFGAILDALTVTRKGRATFRASRPDRRLGNRVYYVWRLTRFHGGRDVTLPMMAQLAVTGDPFEPELDALASRLAKSVFGTDMAAAYRWANALGGSVAIPDGQPASAYSGGPVIDDHKPEDERGELS